MALSKPLDTVIGEELECGICLERLKSPRLLTCLHSFCEQCLQRYVSDNRIEKSLACPACRDLTAIPTSGIAGLRPDFRANKFLKALEEEEERKAKYTSTEKKCSLCDSPKAIIFCIECDVIMCKLCSGYHMKMPLSRNHKTNQISELLKGELNVGRAKSASTCSRHDEQLKFYCKTCFMPICADCTVLDHNKADGHDCVYLKEIMPQLRLELSELSEKVEAKQMTLQAFSKAIGEGKGAFKNHYGSIDKQIEDELAKIKQTLLKKSGFLRIQCFQEMADIEQKNELALKAVNNVANVVHKVTSTSDDIEVAGMFQSLRDSVNNMSDETPNKSSFNILTNRVETLSLKLTSNEHSLHPSIGLTQKRICVDPKPVSKAVNVYLVFTLPWANHAQPKFDVIYKNKSGHVDIAVLEKKSSQQYGNHPCSCSRGDGSQKIFRWEYRQQSSSSHGNVYYEGRSTYMYTVKGPCALLPNGKLCYVSSRSLYMRSVGSSSSSQSQTFDLYTLLQQSGMIPKKQSYEECTVSDITADTSGYVYITFANIKNAVLVLKDNNTKFCIKTGEINPSRVAVCKDSPNMILVAHDSSRVFKLNKDGKIFRTIRVCADGEMEDVAIASDKDEKVYVLYKKNSICTLKIFNANNKLILKHMWDINKMTSGESSNISGQPSKNTHDEHRLSIAVTSDGTIAAALGGPEVVLIYVEEIDAQ